MPEDAGAFYDDMERADSIIANPSPPDVFAPSVASLPSRRRSPLFTKADIATVMGEFIETIQKLREAGQKEYAHADDDPFRNFFALGAELQMPASKVLWTYMRKHLDGILAHVNGHRSQREPVHGRIADTIVYLIILSAMEKEREQIESGRATTDGGWQLMLHGFEAP